MNIYLVSDELTYQSLSCEQAIKLSVSPFFLIFHGEKISQLFSSLNQLGKVTEIVGNTK